ncbi:MAG: hypothetical protein ACRDV1_03800 [Actinomycetes bacterium]
MTEQDPRPADSSGDDASYEIRIVGVVPADLFEGFDDVAISTTRTETVLRGSVGNQGELHALLEELQTLGLVLAEVHRLPPGTGPTAGQQHDVQAGGGLG